MSDLLTYSLSDFVLYSPATFARLFERYHQAIEPLPWIGLALGGLILWLVWHGRGRWVVAGSLAIAWIWIGLGFLEQRFAQLTIAATYFGWAFAAQGLLLIRGARIEARPRHAGVFLMAFAIVVHPVINLAAGHAWPTTGLFGTAPDPTAVATLGLALTFRNPLARWLFVPIPAIWCVFSALSAFGLHRPALAITVGAGLLIWIAIVIWKRHD